MLEKKCLPAIYTLFAIYIPSFIFNFFSVQPYKINEDELDAVLKESEIGSQSVSQPPTLPSIAAHSQKLSHRDKSEHELEKEIDVEEILVLEKDDPHVFRTLLTGLPSPTSNVWSLITALTNVTLVAMATDLVFRGPLLYPSNDLAFARVGYVSESSAKILVRESNLTQLPIYVSYRIAESRRSVTSGLKPIDDGWKSAGGIYWLSNETDYTSVIQMSSLRPDTRYQYMISSSRHTGSFRTAPQAGQSPHQNDGKFTFLTSSCIKPHFPYNPLSHPLSIPGFRDLAKWIPKLHAQFMLFLGDFIYVDVPVRFGTDVESYRREYRQVYSSPDWPLVSKQLPWIHVLDDHEIANDWDKNTTGVYQVAVDPWEHYHTSVNPPEVREGASYFSFTQGPATFFLLDTRRYRTPEFEAPSNSSEKSMLGSEQLHDLIHWLRSPEPAGVRWKIIASSIPFTKNWRFGSQDTWGGYLAERQVLLEAMWDVGLRGGVGTVVLSGDRHEFAATAFPPPTGGRWPLSATVHEFSTSPLSQFYLPVRTYEQRDEEDVCIKYVPDGNSKFGAIEITSPEASDQSVLEFKLFVDGEMAWSNLVTTPPDMAGGSRGKDALWG
ncbi:MAG: hypothetical protein M1827_000356 [Pycnora praestabilis]|nr:MAG: hypothetical protein M1827_000356 [Pycnora praestabilis]